MASQDVVVEKLTSFFSKPEQLGLFALKVCGLDLLSLHIWELVQESTLVYFEPNKSQGMFKNMDVANPMNLFVCLIFCLLADAITGWEPSFLEVPNTMSVALAFGFLTIPASKTHQKINGSVFANGGRLGNLRSPKQFSLGCEGFTSTAPGRSDGVFLLACCGRWNPPLVLGRVVFLSIKQEHRCWGYTFLCVPIHSNGSLVWNCHSNPAGCCRYRKEKNAVQHFGCRL